MQPSSAKYDNPVGSYCIRSYMVVMRNVQLYNTSGTRSSVLGSERKGYNATATMQQLECLRG